MQNPAPDANALKQRLKATWDAGDYSTFATYMEPGAVEHYRRYYGPVNRAFAALDEARQASLRRDLEEVFSKYNAAGDGTMQPDAEFLDVQAVRA